MCKVNVRNRQQRTFFTFSMNNQKINRFIQRLGKPMPSSTVDNFYHKSSEGYFLKRKNLRIYLHKMIELQPKIILVGEAPGYKGCKLTGVPFSSERLMLEEQLPFGQSIGYKLLAQMRKPTSESSATILWQTIWKAGITPLCWNAFPFHPHHHEQPNSNRKPTKEERIAGSYFLKRIIHLYKPDKVVAVGQSATDALELLKMEHQHIRHPSYGGKRDFEDGISNLIG